MNYDQKELVAEEIERLIDKAIRNDQRLSDKIDRAFRFQDKIMKMRTENTQLMDGLRELLKNLGHASDYLESPSSNSSED